MQCKTSYEQAKINVQVHYGKLIYANGWSPLVTFAFTIEVERFRFDFHYRYHTNESDTLNPHESNAY